MKIISAGWGKWTLGPYYFNAAVHILMKIISAECPFAPPGRLRDIELLAQLLAGLALGEKRERETCTIEVSSKIPCQMAITADRAYVNVAKRPFQIGCHTVLLAVVGRDIIVQ